MAAVLLVPPAREPLTLADAKAYLRVEHDDDDDLVATLTSSARAEVEARTRRALLTQRWRVVLDAWPADGRIVVNPSPVREVVAARGYDESGRPAALDTQIFVVDPAAAPGIVSLPPWAAPMPGRMAAGIEIDIECGYGDTAADVPPPLVEAVRLLLAHAYEHRGLSGPADAAPARIAGLVAPFRAVTL